MSPLISMWAARIGLLYLWPVVRVTRGEVISTRRRSNPAEEPWGVPLLVFLEEHLQPVHGGALISGALLSFLII